MGYAVTTMMKLNSSGGGKPIAVAPNGSAPVATSTPAAATPTATPAAAPTLSGSLAVAPVTPAPTDTSGLISAIKPTADSGQLQSFSRFEGKDPFALSSGGSSSSGGPRLTRAAGPWGSAGARAGAETAPPP